MPQLMVAANIPYVATVAESNPVDFMKKAAKAVGEKSIEMVHVKDINAVTGYIRGGCTPIGMKKQFRTFVDETAALWDSIVFSAGRRGYQVDMDPNKLAELVSATFGDITN